MYAILNCSPAIIICKHKIMILDTVKYLQICLFQDFHYIYAQYIQMSCKNIKLNYFFLDKKHMVGYNLLSIYKDIFLNFFIRKYLGAKYDVVYSTVFIKVLT